MGPERQPSEGALGQVALHRLSPMPLCSKAYLPKFEKNTRDGLEAGDEGMRCMPLVVTSVPGPARSVVLASSPVKDVSVPQNRNMEMCKTQQDRKFNS